MTTADKAQPPQSDSEANPTSRYHAQPMPTFAWGKNHEGYWELAERVRTEIAESHEPTRARFAHTQAALSNPIRPPRQYRRRPLHLIPRIVVVVPHELVRQRDLAQSFAEIAIVRLLVYLPLYAHEVHDLPGQPFDRPTHDSQTHTKAI